MRRCRMSDAASGCRQAPCSPRALDVNSPPAARSAPPPWRRSATKPPSTRQDQGAAGSAGGAVGNLGRTSDSTSRSNSAPSAVLASSMRARASALSAFARCVSRSNAATFADACSSALSLADSAAAEILTPACCSKCLAISSASPLPAEAMSTLPTEARDTAEIGAPDAIRPSRCRGHVDTTATASTAVRAAAFSSERTGTLQRSPAIKAWAGSS
mmetsp:Transcript_32004/g.91230  ORF Transcript_32004/g.91230 Transcript_32004/m.91230 type:complete len:215 (-) Transcript_32004:123-767(-)